jgi:hypothetical protein
MTARFILYLRIWETKQSIGGLEDLEINLETDEAPATDPISSRGSAVQRTIQTIQIYVDDFGEDPVHRAERTRRQSVPQTPV